MQQGIELACDDASSVEHSKRRCYFDFFSEILKIWRKKIQRRLKSVGNFVEFDIRC